MEKRNRILIVDDAVDTVDLLRKRLRFDGYDTIEAYDGEEGLRQAASGSPDLIILDIMMPKMDGYEVCRRLKANRNTAFIPILMLTAKTDVEDKVQGLDIGAHDYMAKPFDYKELSARIKSLLAIREAGEKLAQDSRAEAMDHMMEELVHELRNPLTSIGGFAHRIFENLGEGNLNRKYAAIIIEEVARLEKMIRHLVELKAAAIAYREPADVNDLVGEVLRQFEQPCKTEGIEVEVKLTEGLPLLSIDREHLKLALSNIIENSIEAMRGAATRRLVVSSGIDGDWVEIGIADTGKGIPKDKIKNVFDPFFTSKVSGPGLGLTFALKIIQEHRGTIAVESESGKGARFSIKLPARRP